ncbi:ribosomal protein S18 acetylase RimI-like enzyme [Scopulibacillus darangshiensis]|uniref:Ribosomal protein S18 acetylase RimI-like enzyme n=1 Tax=Scopulibacillus darangshiensis TaxID=442528 RepID=A0A4V2SMX8_9BACL|nr:ribosomal protein S18 acetylase RimI-like enzyme [Scopulibacillus darangshiensis]
MVNQNFEKDFALGDRTFVIESHFEGMDRLVVKYDTEVNIRKGQLKDAKQILEIQQNVIAEHDYLITVLDEFNKTIEQQIDWMHSILENDRETIIVAEISEKTVGWIVCQSPGRKRLSHIGSLGMMIDKNYRDSGIGKKLINEVINWAVNNPMIEKLSLGVLSTNHRAIALYTRMGFVEEGRKMREIKMDENEYVDDILMYKLV